MRPGSNTQHLRHHLASAGCDVRMSRLSLSVAALLLQLPAFAQQPPSASLSAQEDAVKPQQATPTSRLGPAVLPEVAITAEKRGSTVQKTPISISAMSGDELQERGIVSAAELARQTPGVAVKSGGPGQTEFTIRGLSSSAGVSPTVGVYLDEIPVSPPTIATAGKVGIDPDLYDLARVEILRGPQGTLYGASSMGGTVKLVPAAPRLNKLEGSVQAIGSGTQGGGTNGTVNAMLNVPLATDTAALRVVLTGKRNSGWIDRVVVPTFPVPDPSITGSYFTAPRGDVASAPPSKVHKNANDETVQGVRAALLLKPNAELTITPSVFFQQIRQGAPNIYDSTPGTQAHYQPFDIAEPFRDKFGIASLKVNYEFDSISLTSATAYTQRNRRQVQDSSEVMQKGIGDFFGLTGFNAASGGMGPTSIAESQPSRQFSQELRLASNDTGSLRWLVGAFYSQLRSSYDASQTAPDAGPVLGETNIYTASLSDKLEQTALFGNLSYDVTPSLRATAGLRYFTSKDTATKADSGLFSSGSGGTTTASDKGMNPMVNLSYTVSRDAMVYATAAKGFRDGAAQQGVPDFCGPDLAALGLTAAPTRFGPDTVWSYEVGSKNALFDRSVTLNVAAYYQKWSKVQQTIQLPTCGFTYTDNAADATVSGLELEVAARLANGLMVEQGIGYTHARFTNDNVGSGTRAGDKLRNVPEWTASTSLRYSGEINDSLGFVGRLGVVYVGPQDVATDQRKTLPGYTLVGLRAGVQADTWAVTAFVDNLANRQVALNNTSALTINVPSLDRVSTNRPRTIGIDFSRRF